MIQDQFYFGLGKAQKAVGTMAIEWLWNFTLFIGCALLISYHWSRRKLYKLSWSLPGYSWPIVGDGLAFMCKNEGKILVVSFSYHIDRSKIRNKITIENVPLKLKATLTSAFVNEYTSNFFPTAFIVGFRR